MQNKTHAKTSDVDLGGNTTGKEGVCLSEDTCIQRTAK